jgi:hypothetical protein
MWMFGCFDGTILGTWFDELVFGIGVTSLWAYFYSVQGTGRLPVDQFCVTDGLCAQGWGEAVILEIREEKRLPVAEVFL